MLGLEASFEANAESETNGERGLLCLGAGTPIQNWAEQLPRLQKQGEDYVHAQA